MKHTWVVFSKFLEAFISQLSYLLRELDFMLLLVQVAQIPPENKRDHK